MIGTIEPSAGVRVLAPDGRPVPILAAGYRHY
jgi:hypothetical protein